jgi:hypothetical protein
VSTAASASDGAARRARKSRTKGKAGEVESSRIWRDAGADVRPLQSGQRERDDAGDYLVTFPGATLIVQCRRRERTRVLEASRQIEAVARENETPAVVYRPSREPWRISMRLDDFVRLVAAPYVDLLPNERAPAP